jgi:hypothetical protein
MQSYRESEFGKVENIYVHTTKAYAWIWRAKTGKGNVSKFYHHVQSSRADAYLDPQLPKLPIGYEWHGPFTY